MDLAIDNAGGGAWGRVVSTFWTGYQVQATEFTEGNSLGNRDPPLDDAKRASVSHVVRRAPAMHSLTIRSVPRAGNVRSLPASFLPDLDVHIWIYAKSPARAAREDVACMWLVPTREAGDSVRRASLVVEVQETGAASSMGVTYTAGLDVTLHPPIACVKAGDRPRPVFIARLSEHFSSAGGRSDGGNRPA